MNGLGHELGAVYKLASGGFARLMAVDADGTWHMCRVCVHATTVVPDGDLSLSAKVACRLHLAWHAQQWAQRVAARAAHVKRVGGLQAMRGDEAAQRSEQWHQVTQAVYARGLVVGRG